MNEIYNSLSSFLLERKYDEKRQKRTKKVLVKYRGAFVDRIDPVKKIKHANNRAGFLISLAKLYKKYGGENIPESEKNNLRRSYGYKEIPSARGAYDWAKSEKSMWEDIVDEMKKKNKYSTSSHDAEFKKMRQAVFFIYAFALCMTILRIVLQQQRMKNRKVKKRRSR